MAIAKRAKIAEPGGADWVTSLSKCIDLSGLEGFPETLVNSLKILVDFDNSVVFSYYQNKKPHCLFHTFSPEKSVVCVDDYLKGPYLLDPFFKVCVKKVDAGLYRLGDIAPDRFYQSEYYRSYYRRTKLADEICYTFYLDKGIAIVISLMRAEESSRFTAREFRQLGSVAPIIVSLARRHWMEVPERYGKETTEKEQTEIHSLTEDTVRAMFSERLTPRETQVVAQVLEGHSSDSIANDLGISVGTVRIHRRNIYAKLQISSQQELFSIFLKKVTNSR
ncbi:MAG: helix-turn-helix transcriptional regulator [Hyphomicrobiales bacterium]|nr:helix-turn-helix transcriptional regulator [Hyphomicrobiales bacterium]